MKSIESQPLKAEKVVLACVVLHNFLRTHYPTNTNARDDDGEEHEGLDGLEGYSDSEDESDADDDGPEETEQQLRNRLRSYLCPDPFPGN